MSKLHELLAVEGDLEGTFRNILEETQNTFKKKPAHFMGAQKRLEMFAEGAPEVADEHLQMVTTVPDKLEYQSEHVIRYFDAVLQKERTNQVAREDIVVDGVTLAEGLPATFLLGLESKLKKLRAVYEAIPTLPPATEWKADENLGKGVYRLVHAEEKFKTAKTFKHKVLYEATKTHPAQIEKWEEMKNVGRFITDRWCGMLSSAEKSVLLGRIDKLIRAVKKARQRANTTEVVEMTVGEELFNYITAR